MRLSLSLPWLSVLTAVLGWDDADLLDNITKDEVLALFMRSVHPASPTRAKLSVHLTSQKCSQGEDKVPDCVTVIEDPKVFKDGLAVASTPGPCIEWGDLTHSRL